MTGFVIGFLMVAGLISWVLMVAGLIAWAWSIDAEDEAKKRKLPPIRHHGKPDCWVVVKDGRIIATHDEPARLYGIDAIRYVPATEQETTTK